MSVSSVFSPPVRFLRSIGVNEGSDSSVSPVYITLDTRTGSLKVNVMTSSTRLMEKEITIGGTRSETRVPGVIGKAEGGSIAMTWFGFRRTASAIKFSVIEI